MAVQNANSTHNTPSLSVVMLAYNLYANVQRAILNLRMQTVANQLEIVLVIPSLSDFGLQENDLGCFQSWQTQEIGRITSIGQGYAVGVASAHAPIVAFTEEHSFPDSGWAERLISDHKSGWAAVGPRVLNGNPHSVVGRADFYLSYGEWSSPVVSGPVRILPGHNSCYKRDMLLELGEELGTLLEAEGILQRRLKASGYKLFLDTEISTSHLNYTYWPSWICKRYYQGWDFASSWSKSWPRPRKMAYILGSPLIPFIRLWRLRKKICYGQPYLKIMAVLPVLLTGLTAEAMGHLAGYWSGVRSCSEKVLKYEINRVEHMKIEGNG